MTKIIRVSFITDLKSLNDNLVVTKKALLEYMMRGGKITNGFLYDDVIQVNIVGEVLQIDVENNSAVCLFYDDSFAEKVITNKYRLGFMYWEWQSRIILLHIGKEITTNSTTFTKKPCNDYYVELETIE